jgi:A/G-specific adenine glycosylase
MNRLALALTAWFEREARPLPWRSNPSPYRVWISEIMAQQTRLETVVPYFRRFIRRFPTVTSLAKSDLDEVLTLWSGLGYYSRARHLHAAARRVVREHGGRIPGSPETLRELPGIGEYTAAAIASIAFQVAVPVLDGNVVRVLSRLYDIPGDGSEPRVRRRLNALGARLLLGANPRILNQALMELGATRCSPRSPDCESCPVHRCCLARRRKTVSLRPRRRSHAKVKTLYLLAGVVRSPRGAVLLVQNPYRSLFGGMWQVPMHNRPKMLAGLPGIRAELRMGLAASLGVRLEVGQELGRVSHGLTHRQLELRVFECRLAGGRLRLHGYRSARWVRRGTDLDRLGVAALTRKVLTAAGLQTTKRAPA